MVVDEAEENLSRRCVAEIRWCCRRKEEECGVKHKSLWW